MDEMPDLEAMQAAIAEQEAERKRRDDEAAALEAEREAEAMAQAEENRAQRQAAAMAALQDEAEGENAERDALAASLAAMAAANANAQPIVFVGVGELYPAPAGRFGPTFMDEIRAAGLLGLPFSWDVERIIFNHDITPEQRAAVVAVAEAHDPTNSDMPRRRQAAFATAMEYGNTITAQVEGQWANVERASFTAQETEARDVMAGKALPADAMLPPLAEHKGVSLQDYAQQILANAAAYRQLAIAAVILRRGAEGLMSETLDTPEKLNDAVQALRGQAEAFAKQLGLTIP